MFVSKSASFAVGAMAIALGLNGCATQKYVDQQVAGLESRQGAALTEQGSKIGGRIDGLETRLNQVDQTARDALARAIAAGKLAEGKFLYSVVMTTDGSVTFASGKAIISDEGQAKLTALANQLKSDNQNVYLEIQGHTDSKGSNKANERVGMERANAVRTYLAKQGVPLSRMSSASYGEDAPVADNATRAGRAANRRVVIVVLK
jgi:peptidoglycan-associated lipoprotein